jgi:hypothetical protein
MVYPVIGGFLPKLFFCMYFAWLIAWEKRILPKLVSFISPQPRLGDPSFRVFTDSHQPKNKKCPRDVGWCFFHPGPIFLYVRKGGGFLVKVWWESVLVSVHGAESEWERVGQQGDPRQKTWWKDAIKNAVTWFFNIHLWYWSWLCEIAWKMRWKKFRQQNSTPSLSPSQDSLTVGKIPKTWAKFWSFRHFSRVLAGGERNVEVLVARVVPIDR